VSQELNALSEEMTFLQFEFQIGRAETGKHGVQIYQRLLKRGSKDYYVIDVTETDSPL
jgi:hypothetical protein